MNFPAIGLRAPQILLPQDNVDLARWAVIACDQYTSQPDYWQQVAEQVGESPSTLKLTFPEVYLEQPDKAERIRAINKTMRDYLDQGVLRPLPEGFVLVDRRTSQVPSRKGLMVALDLEQYDYRPGSGSLIRATEGTILDRLPPRIQVREQACLELPHIMVLIDDPGQTVIEPLFKEQLPPLYDFELMAGGGHLRGWQVSEQRLLRQVADALAALAEPKAFAARYQVENQSPLLYAMGDGNHSFATAKAIWEQLKAEASDPAAIMDHPARWALVELVNLHDPGLEFEAIHRVLFGIETTQLLVRMEAYYRQFGCGFVWQELDSVEAVMAEVDQEVKEGVHRLPLIAGGRCGVVEIGRPASNLAVGTLQAFLDQLAAQEDVRIDYIHGADVVTELGSRPGNAGFYLPAISKFELFRTIILDGALPRKTFSMGEADEKRFYLECRKIKQD
ncbi:DUF1015 domain-containing protein [Geothermobacter hydrogeniphilus]|uniref:DUF1015 domain-containing protein n=1 Tax=Geothermobacter hydrogeniphilus TaxID=1969733 RepID=A0A1X0YAT2_9BACT|nr:DUF1015 domain-containing protein [Geothermobacter hydrogeniphilus]ORJ62212.1 hypothetical protein B5V00_04655 [Geothermobacter hydrogeniphilus]